MSVQKQLSLHWISSEKWNHSAPLTKVHQDLPFRTSTRNAIHMKTEKKMEKMFLYPKTEVNFSKSRLPNAGTSRLLSGKLNKGLGYMKEMKGQVEVSCAVPTHVTGKAEKQLHHAKEKAKEASTALSAQVTSIAQSGVRMAKLIGRSGGA